LVPWNQSDSVVLFITWLFVCHHGKQEEARLQFEVISSYRHDDEIENGYVFVKVQSIKYNGY